MAAVTGLALSGALATMSPVSAQSSTQAQVQTLP